MERATGARGIEAVGLSGHGVFAGTNDNNSAGVCGFHNASGVGVLGKANSNDGVQGQSQDSNHSGVAGLNYRSGTGTYGFSSGGDGLVGIAGGAGRGAYVHSAQGDGLFAGASGPGRAIYAYNAGTGPAIVAVVAQPNNLAGFFQGRVDVLGQFLVFGPKSAAVPHPDGDHRLLYSLESPESWFEDFGEAELVNGHATVKFDPDFACVVRLNRYHVFVAPYGNSSGIHVSRRTEAGFEVTENNNGKSNLPFSYRIVALRKDISPKRPAKVALPPDSLTAPPQTPVIADRELSKD